ncbi:MAG: DUF4855 domain-containing protein [Candidatus Woodwardiibium sp.]
MKRFKRAAALLLALSMLAAAGCTDQPEETSSAAESGSSDSSDTSSEPFVEPEVNEVRDRVDALYGTPADRSLKANNALSGLLPAFSRPASSDYPGNGGRALTDGVRTQIFDTQSWVGFNGREPVTLTFDLGEVVDGLADFEVGAFEERDYGIGLPAAVAVSVSTDGENFSWIGSVLAPAEVSGTEAYPFTLRLAGTVSARYIRYEIGAPSNTWLFIDEVTAVRYGAGADGDGPTSGEVGDYYGDTDIPEITEPEYWDPSESDYAQERNLIAGLPQQIEQLAPFSAEVATTFYNSKEDAAMLTDGKFAGQAAYSDPAYFRFTGGLGRTILYDLGRESAVSSFAGSFLYELSTAVGLPRRLLIKASRNGVDWQTIHVTEAFKTSETAARVEIAEAFDQTYRARYIEFVFPVNTHVYCDELAVYGTKRIPDDAADLVADAVEVAVYPDKYITPDDFLGVNNMLLSYNHDPASASGGKTTAEEYMPFVGYYDRGGKLADTFFDSFLFLPYGAYVNEENGDFTAWNAYVDNVFAEDANVNALSEAVEQVSEGLGRDVRVSVFFSILYTWPDKTSFGDVDGDGVVENFTKIEDRKKAIKWIIDEQLSRFEAGGYDNLDLLGFYWYEEQVTYTDPHELELIRYASDYVHSLGYKLMWIPWYCAPGHTDWKELGFDMACMQPNYAFSGQATVERLYDNAETTRRLGMCVEIEIGQYDAQADILRYKEYLAVGAETGYMDAVKCYYQAGMPGAFYAAWKSADPFVNSVYHDTYLFAKGKYDSNEAAGGAIADPSDLEMDTSSGRGVTGSLNVETESDYRVRIGISPKYGTLRFGGGTVTYTPLAGFAGTDTFTVYLEYIHGDSKTATVTVRVHEK